MIVKAPEPKYPPAPEGTFPAVCVDEIDLGMVENKKFGGSRHMVRLVWQIDEEVDNDTAAKFRTLKAGSRYLITQDYTASLDEKAKLRKHLQSWRGRAFTPVELFSFDLETIVGAPCLINIVNTRGSRGDMVWANVEAVMKLPKGTEALQVNGYVRVKDRKVTELKEPELVSQPRTRQEKPPEEQPPDWNNLNITDDDVPF